MGARFKLNGQNIRILPPPRDSEVLVQFRTHVEGFRELLRMLSEDSALEFLSDDYWRPDALKIGKERVKRYRSLMRESNISDGIERLSGHEGVEFYAWGFGCTVTEEYTKGIAYLRRRPEHVAADLDSVRFDPRKRFEAFRHISGNWYLFFTFVP